MKERIVVLRHALKLPQREFARRIGVTTGTVGGWECGAAPIPAARVFQICDVFGVNREWLDSGAGEMYKAPKSEETAPDAHEATIRVLRSMYERLTAQQQEILLKAITERVDALKSPATGGLISDTTSEPVERASLGATCAKAQTAEED